ncbi:MAG: response regulator transcription factor [Anaerolineales bacterium]
MINEQISLVVVDDHSGVRKSISSLLKTTEDIFVVGEAETGNQAIQIALAEKPDIMLLDVELPDQRGTAVMEQLHNLLPEMKVLAISSYNDQQFILEMMESGASGYLTKDNIPAKLIEAVRSIVYQGRKWIGPHIRKQDKSRARLEQTLTKNEITILKQLAHDTPEKTISANMGIDEQQVGKFLKILKNKYQVKSLSELKRIAQQMFPDP